MVDHFLDQLAGDVLEVLRHHDFEQARLFRFGGFRHGLGELPRIAGQRLELLDAELAGKQLRPSGLPCPWPSLTAAPVPACRRPGCSAPCWRPVRSGWPTYSRRSWASVIWWRRLGQRLVVAELAQRIVQQAHDAAQALVHAVCRRSSSAGALAAGAAARRRATGAGGRARWRPRPGRTGPPGRLRRCRHRRRPGAGAGVGAAAGALARCAATSSNSASKSSAASVIVPASP